MLILAIPGAMEEAGLLTGVYPPLEINILLNINYLMLDNIKDIFKFLVVIVHLNSNQV